MEESKVKTTAEHIRCPESAIELLADIDVFKALRMPQEALNIIDLYVKSHITKLETRISDLKQLSKNQIEVLRDWRSEIEKLEARNKALETNLLFLKNVVEVLDNKHQYSSAIKGAEQALNNSKQ